ncbi:MFS transporter [Metabacillus hrfriensis]|uniref:MFS transporter n=1 Tax=Metabacillus hrfriensis TaxID=3048891 RepID=A0ACD4R9F3_9BACI|nr:MFS transporter [Metabacillus sp. CT-WN-B3]WHZ57089.1 MFS transporter [Metabacillus sp. CT-WN-B3]
MTYIQQGTQAFRKANFAFFAAGFNTFSILYCMQPLMPEFTRDFGISPTSASLSLSVTTIALAVSMLFFASLSDAWGRKPIMVISMFIASFLCLLTAFSPNFHILLILRILVGISLAGLPSIAMAYLGEEVDPKSLGKAMGLYISGNALGAVFGRIFTGILTDYYDWHFALAGVGAISLIATLIFGVSLSPSRNFKPCKLEIRGLGMSLIKHLKDPGLVCLFLMGFFLLGSNVALFNYIGYLLMDEPYSLSQSFISWFFLIYLIGMFSSSFIGKLIDKHGRSKVLFINLVISILGVFLTLFPSLLIKIIGLGLFIFGFFGGHSIASSWVGQRALNNKAQASSLYLFLYYAGSSIGGSLGGIFWTSFGWAGLICMVAVFLLLTLILTVCLIKLSKLTSIAKPFISLKRLGTKY